MDERLSYAKSMHNLIINLAGDIECVNFSINLSYNLHIRELILKTSLILFYLTFVYQL